MRLLNRSILLLMLIFALTSCKKNLTAEELPAHIVRGETYYTQFVIRYEKNAHSTTNYRRGASIPVNTPIKLIDINTKIIEIEISASGQPITIKNIEKHTGDDTIKAFDKLFAKDKVNLAQFNGLERKHIQDGSVAKGMRKKAVTVAIGYPPITETYSLDADTWVYWSGRFNKFNVIFRNDKVINIVD